MRLALDLAADAVLLGGPPPHFPAMGPRFVLSTGVNKRDGSGQANRSRGQDLEHTGRGRGTQPSKLKNQVRDSCPEVQCPVS